MRSRATAHSPNGSGRTLTRDWRATPVVELRDLSAGPGEHGALHASGPGRPALRARARRLRRLQRHRQAGQQLLRRAGQQHDRPPGTSTSRRSASARPSRRPRRRAGSIGGSAANSKYTVRGADRRGRHPDPGQGRQLRSTVTATPSTPTRSRSTSRAAAAEDPDVQLPELDPRAEVGLPRLLRVAGRLDRPERRRRSATRHESRLCCPTATAPRRRRTSRACSREDPGPDRDHQGLAPPRRSARQGLTGRLPGAARSRRAHRGNPAHGTSACRFRP